MSLIITKKAKQFLFVNLIGDNILDSLVRLNHKVLSQKKFNMTITIFMKIKITVNVIRHL